MKNSALALTIVLALLASIMARVPFMNVARANFIPAAEIVITSPANTTYNSNLLVLNYTVYFTLTKNQLVVYSIDGGANVTVLSKHSSQFYEIVCKQVMLPELSDGSHYLEVYAVYAGREGASDHDQVYFTIDTTPPVVSDLSEKNKTYYSTNMPLNFTVSDPASQITYSLDGQQNETIAGNTTLTNLSYGKHNLTVYAADLAGNVGVSETICFNITEPFPTVPVATASTVAIVAVAAGLLIYFKKHKTVN